MSLINQMLQDLEKRRASGAERGALPDQVRVLPREEIRGVPWWLIGIAAAVSLAALFAWQFSQQQHATPRVPLTQTEARPDPLPPAVVVTTLETGGPASRLAFELQNIPASTDAPGPSKSRTPDAQGLSKGKPAAPALPAAAVVAVEPSPIARPVPAASVAELPKPAVPPARKVEVGAESKAPATPVSPQIDKRAQVLTSQQLAENSYRDAANLLNQGRLPEAQEGFRHALQQNPAHTGARQGLFGLLLDAKKNNEAEQVLQDGLKLNPNQPGFAMALASLQYERGDVTEAIDTMQRSASAAQSSPDYLARLAGLLQRQSRHKEAIENYQAALRIAPGSGVWLMGLGISLQASNRNGEAQEAFRRARSSNTLNPELQAFVDQRLKQLQ